MSLITILKKYRKEQTTFTISQLKKAFPQEKELIDRYKFLGLIEPACNTNHYVYRSKVA